MGSFLESTRNRILLAVAGLVLALLVGVGGFMLLGGGGDELAALEEEKLVELEAIDFDAEEAGVSVEDAAGAEDGDGDVDGVDVAVAVEEGSAVDDENGDVGEGATGLESENGGADGETASEAGYRDVGQGPVVRSSGGGELAELERSRSEDICDLPASLQNALIDRLGISQCSAITLAELKRIEDLRVDFSQGSMAELQAWSLEGLSNVLAFEAVFRDDCPAYDDEFIMSLFAPLEKVKRLRLTVHTWLEPAPDLPLPGGLAQLEGRARQQALAEAAREIYQYFEDNPRKSERQIGLDLSLTGAEVRDALSWVQARDQARLLIPREEERLVRTLAEAVRLPWREGEIGGDEREERTVLRFPSDEFLVSVAFRVEPEEQSPCEQRPF